MHNTFQSRQHGAALIFGLITMLVLTVLSLAVMQMAKSELGMARGQSLSSMASATAEAALENQLGSVLLTPSISAIDQPLEFPSGFNAGAAGEYSITSQGIGPVPSGGNTLGQFQAYFFDFSATASIDSGYNTTVRQGVYVIAPN